MMYNKKITSTLLDQYDSFGSFLEKTYSIVNNECYPADQEIYGNLVERDFSDEYIFVDNFPVHYTGQNWYGEHTDINKNHVEAYISWVKQNLPWMASCSYHSWQ